MDPIKTTTRGRKPINYINDEALALKQHKRHEYYIKFKSNHPNYYKKLNSVLGRPKSVQNIPEKSNVIHKMIDEIITKLQDLKKIDE